MDGKHKVEMSLLSFSVFGLVQSHEEFLKTVDFVVGISRGGLVPAALVATRINKPLVAMYIDKQDNMYIDRTDWLDGKNILLVDDVCRTGKTLSLAVKLLEEKAHPSKVTTMTVYDEDCNGKVYTPSYSFRMHKEVIMPWDYDKQQDL